MSSFLSKTVPGPKQDLSDPSDADGHGVIPHFGGGGRPDDTFTGDSGNNTINGTNNDDFFNMTDGGNDTVNGLGGNDVFSFGATLTAADKVNGGTGYDSVLISGNYSAGLTFAATTLVNVEEIDCLGSTNSYKLTMNDANLTSDQVLVVSASGDSSHTLNFDGSAESGDGFFAITSGAGADTVKFGGNANKASTGAGNDTITISGSNAGHDTISAGDGNDTLNFGVLFNSSDSIDGGTGFDTLNISGDYSSRLSMSATTLLNVEKIALGAGHSYWLETSDATVASGQTLTIDGSTLGSGNTMIIFGGAETNGGLILYGGAGTDTLDGGAGGDTILGNAGDDVINTGTGGTDFVNGGAGNDTIGMGGSLDASDTINGGGGNDLVQLYGDYSAGVVLGANSIQNITTLELFGGGHSYNLTFNDGNIAAGGQLLVEDNSMTAADSVTLDDSAETDGKFNVSMTGPETLNIKLGSGGDSVTIGSALTAADHFDGGAGFDTLHLNGGTAGHIDLSATSIVNFESIDFQGQVNYDIKLNDATFAPMAGYTVIGDGGQLASNTLTVDASSETDTQLLFELSGPGTKAVHGGALSDEFWVYGNLQATDSIDGGGGGNSISFDGDYSAGLTLGATTVLNVAQFTFTGNDSYAITTNDATVAAGQSLDVSATGLTNKDSLDFDGSAETDGTFSMSGGAGGDVLIGGTGNDTFSPGAGNDQVHGGGGDDTLYFYTGEFGVGDQIDGGSGFDTLTLDGDYSAPVFFAADTMTNIERIVLDPGFTYALMTDDGNVGSGQVLQVEGSALGATNHLLFDGSQETDGAFVIAGGAGDDTLVGGDGDDLIEAGGGSDQVNGGGGNDTIFFTAGFDATDTIDGGSGKADTLELAADYSAGVTFAATTMVNIDVIRLDQGHSYDMTLDDANLGAGHVLTVDASTLLSGDAVTFDGSAETDGSFAITGGSGDDTLSGGANDDTIQGGFGNNLINGNGGDDALTGGIGNDTINGGDGEDNISGGNGGHDVLDGGNDGDTITAIANSTLTGDGGDDLLSSGAGSTMSGGDGNDLILSNGGSSSIDGGDGDDDIEIQSGSADTVTAGNGDDTINFAANFSATDRVDGGAGTDTVGLSGDYSVNVTLAAATLANVETLLVKAGFSYNLTSNDGNVAAGQTLTVDASALGALSTLSFNGAAESDGMFAFIGGAGNDTLTGGTGNDTFDLSHGGDDFVLGGGGTDTFVMGAALSANDQINGGAGIDTVELAGNYSAGLTLNATTLVGIETVTFGAGFSYALTLNDGDVASGKTLTLDGSALGTTDKLTLDGSQETNGHFAIAGGAGDDVLTGGALSDTFDLTHGGKETLAGGAGDDTFNFGATFGAGDKVDGGTGTDTIVLNGDYSTQLNFGQITLSNVEVISLKDGFSYNLHPADTTVAAGKTLTIDGSHLGATSVLSFNGASETDGTYSITGGAANDVISGGAGNDTLNGGGGDDIIDASGGGNDTVSGGGGINTIKFGANLTAQDSIDGGGNNNTTVQLNGNYAGLTLGAATIQNVGIIKMAASHNYVLTSNDGNVAAGKTLTIDGTSLGASDHLTFNGSAETNGTFTLDGGAGNDTLTGGAGIDHFRGGLGADVLNGGGGADVFVYKAAAESTGATYDTLAGFDFSSDQIDVKKVTAIDAGQSGSVSTATMDGDLANIFTAAHLGAWHAAVLTATSGTLSGHTFLVVDANGTAGYQAGADYVFDVTGASHIASLSTADFV